MLQIQDTAAVTESLWYVGSVSRLIDFQRDKLKNPTSGLTRSEMLEKGDVFFFGTTNWITWLFPCKKRSCSLDSIIATEEELLEFKSSRDLQGKVLLSLNRVLRLYGFQLSTTDSLQSIARAADFDTKKLSWLQLENPNLNRIARILQSLMLVGLPRVAEMWLYALEGIAKEHPRDVGDMIDYWRASVHDPSEWQRGGRYCKAGGF
jgi:hypothetical protein